MASPKANVPTPVSFPRPDSPEQRAPSSPHSPTTPQAKRSRTSTNASSTSVGNRVRSASLKLMEASPPPGMWAATGSVTSKAPSLADIRSGSYGSEGWSENGQRQAAQRRASQSEESGGWLQRRLSNTPSAPDSDSTRRPKGMQRGSSDRLKAAGVEPFPALTEEETGVVSTREVQPEGDTAGAKLPEPTKGDGDSEQVQEKPVRADKAGPHTLGRQWSNGYEPPPKLPWTTSTAIALKAFWKWFLTPTGFLITLYGLNVVAWGGMLFLLLCNAAPAMCHPTCDDIQSPRRIWVEIDSQILNALFCVTGFGLAPWRFRDLYWWAFWRIGGASRKQIGIRRLAGIHRGWFRLPGSENLPKAYTADMLNPEDPAVPIPHTKAPDAPPTGRHAPPTKPWHMDFVVWMNVWNTFFQIVLCFYMWHYNRYDRPSWATGLFVALGCGVAGAGGIMMFVDGKAVKKVEGVPMPEGGYGSGQMDVEASAPLVAGNGSTKQS